MGPRTRSSTPKRNAAAKAEKSPKSSSAKKRRTRSASQGEKSVESLASPKDDVQMVSPPSKKVDAKMISDVVVAKTAPTQPATPSVDLFVHRLRYLRYIPAAILCIQASPTVANQSKKKSDTYVAISRQDGQVELRSTRQKFRTLATVAGWSSTAVHAMAWTCHRTLVGATKDGSLVVIDFQRGHFRNVTPSGGGQIHALDSFRGDNTGNCPSLVGAGCEDGSVRFFQVEDHDEDDNNMVMPVISTIPSTGAPILSLSLNRFGAVSKEKSINSPLAGATVFVGVADGTIRRYDCSQGPSSWKSTLRITVESLGRNIPTRIWALKSLHDGTLVSGDSLGHVQLWDGHSGTLEASFNQNDSKADVLCLDVTRNQNKIFASGVDSRVICIERSSEATEDRKWVLTNAQRPHTHDVQAVAVCYRSKKKGSGSEMLCTGGIDTKLCVYGVNEFQQQRPHTIFPCPVQSPVSIAAGPRILSVMRRDCVQIYSLAPRPDSLMSCPLPVKESDSLLGTVKIDSHFNLSVSTVSADGKYLVVGNSSNILLFQLGYVSGKGSAKSSIRPKRLPLELPSRSPILAAKFARNDQLLLCSADRCVHVVTFSTSDKANVTPVASVQSTIPLATDNLDSSSTFLPDDLVCSADGKWFATIRGHSEKGSVQVFKETDGSFVHWWSIPELDVPPAAAAFLHTDHPQLVLVCSNFAPYVFDLEGRSLSNWSKGAGFPLGDSLPSSLQNRRDSPIRIAINPNAPHQFLVVSQCFEKVNARKVIPGSMGVYHFFCLLGCHPCESKLCES